MMWAHWVLILAALAWVALMWWLAKVPIRREDRGLVVEVEDVLGPYTVTIPVDGDQLAFDREFHEIIEQGWRR